jgi:tRNA dimethylallyltransferase
MADDVLVITGPTATGKTALGIGLARELDGEIISMDSRQVYRGMDIGTAKPAIAERAGVVHHGFDRVSPNERYSAGRFAREARSWIDEIRGRGRTPILVGGTGFFLRALTHPLFAEPPLDGARQRTLHARMDTLDTDALRRWVRQLDPASPLGVAGGGRQRLLRTIEIALLTGRPLSWWHTQVPGAAPALDPVIFVLDLAPALLRARIDARVLAMIEHGLVDEVRTLLDRGYHEHDPGMDATGYAELIPYLHGTRSLEEAIQLTQAATRRYARRQRTWFRHQLPDGAVRLDAARPQAQLVEVVAQTWKRAAR